MEPVTGRVGIEAAGPLYRGPVSASMQTRGRPGTSMMSVRSISIVVAVFSAAAMVACGFAMASRIAAYHKANPREVFAFQRIDYPSFEIHGREVEFTDETQDGIAYLNVRYGDRRLRLLVTIPGNAELPGLLPHEQWLRVLMFASAVGRSIDQVHDDLRSRRVEPRMVVVTRTPRPGEPQAYAGRMNPKAWTFDFHEFMPGGEIEHQKLRFPTTRQHQPDKEGELRENTWQYQAALSVIPTGISPKPKFSDDGLRASGWTLPATTGATLIMLGAICVGAISGRRAASSRVPTTTSRAD